jgi:hypothetical protein
MCMSVRGEREGEGVTFAFSLKPLQLGQVESTHGAERLPEIVPDITVARCYVNVIGAAKAGFDEARRRRCISHKFVTIIARVHQFMQCTGHVGQAVCEIAGVEVRIWLHGCVNQAPHFGLGINPIVDLSLSPWDVWGVNCSNRRNKAASWYHFSHCLDC